MHFTTRPSFNSSFPTITIIAVIFVASLNSTAEAKKKEASDSGFYDMNGGWVTEGTASDTERSAVPLALPSQWSSPSAVAELNTEGQNHTTFVSADGLDLILYSDRTGGLGGDDLWLATRPDPTSPFSVPVHMGSGVNSTSEDVQGSMTANGLQLVFVRSNGLWFSNDLYMTSRTTTAEAFGTAVPLTELNTSGADAYPNISPDGLTLYFTSSRGSLPTGDIGDIWFATRTIVTGSFTAPQKLMDVNSSFTELSFSVSSDGLYGYLTSYRDGIIPQIYQVTRTTPTSFSTPTIIPSLSTPGNFRSGACVTGNRDEMFFSVGTPYYIMRATRNASNALDWSYFE